MIAELATQRVNDFNLVNKDSTWINGYDRMKKDHIFQPNQFIK